MYKQTKNVFDIRAERAKTQKLYLINRNVDNDSATFDVMGSRGVSYVVELSGVPSCTCPDHETRGTRCKHILFILIRIFNLADPYQKKFTDEEIKGYLKRYKDNVKKLNVKVNIANGQIEVDIKGLDDDCAICLDPVQNGEKYLYCKRSCGRCLHSDCFDMYSKHKHSTKCVYCANDFVC